MNTFHKVVAAAGLAMTFAVATLGTVPAVAAPPFVMHHQMKHAARLDRRAMVAAMNGHPRKAARLRAHARRLRSMALNGH